MAVWEPVAVGMPLAYGIGSISFALLVGAVTGGVDIRRHGSGNVGATNVGRVLGRRYGFLVYGLDFGKGLATVVLLPPLLERLFGVEPGGLARFGFYFGLAAVVGHIFPFYLRFRGGKGVATGSGVFAAVLLLPTIAAAAVWAGVLLATRLVSLASIAAAVSLPAAFAILEPSRALRERPDLLVASILLAALVVARHGTNIRRLLAGTEARIGDGGSRPKKGDHDA